MLIFRNGDLKLTLLFANSGGSVIFAFLSLYLKDNHYIESQIAVLGVVFSACLIISNSTFGRLADDIGRRPFLLLGLFAAGLSAFSYSFASTFSEFLVVRIAHGVAMGIYPASITGIASDRNAKLGNLSSFGSLGWAIGSYTTGILAEFTGLGTMFYLSSFLFSVAFLIALASGEGRGYLISVSDSKSTPLGKYLLAFKKNWFIYLVALLRHGTANSIWIFWAIFLQNVLGYSTGQIGILQVMNTFTQFLVMQRIGDRYRPSLMFVVGTFASAATFFLFTIITVFWLMALANILLGFSWGLFYVGGLRLVESRSKKTGNVGTATGLYNATFSAASLVGPILAILFFSFSGVYTFSMDMAALVTILAGVFLVFLFRQVDGI